MHFIADYILSLTNLRLKTSQIFDFHFTNNKYYGKIYLGDE